MTKNSLKIKLLFTTLLVAITSAQFHGCVTGSEIPNEVDGILVDQNGKPQGGATVSLIPSDRIPGKDSTSPVVTSVITAANGQYKFKNVSTGFYNVIASKNGFGVFEDSLLVGKAGLSVGQDTLKAPGVMIGTIHLEPPDSPRMALVQVIGTEIYVNVDSSGRFALTEMPAGHYRIRIFVAGSDYIPEFRTITVRSGFSDTLTAVISPYYTGPTRISGVSAQALSNGSIQLTWNKSPANRQLTVGIFREPMNFIFMCGNAMAYVTGTSFIDTIYSATPRSDPFGFRKEDWPNSCYTGQFPLADTTAYEFQYKIWVFTGDGQTLGLPSQYAKVVAVHPH